MAKVKVQVNSEEPVVPEGGPIATEGAVITDKSGRVLKLREVDFLDQSRLVRVLGPDAAMNSIYMNGYVLPAAMVASINGEECIMPMTAKEIDAAIVRVGRVGTNAVIEFTYKQLESSLQETDALKNS